MSETTLSSRGSFFLRVFVFLVGGVLGFNIMAQAIRPEPGLTEFNRSMVRDHGVHVSSMNVPYLKIATQLPNGDRWQTFIMQLTAPEKVFIDPRSGAPTNIILSYPIIPGSGKGNRLTLPALERELGESLSSITPAVVDQLMRRFIARYQDILRVDPEELDDGRIQNLGGDLWNINYGRRYRGYPVRRSRVIAVINHGNLVVIGTEIWGPIHLENGIRITANEAVEAAYRFIRKRMPDDRIEVTPHIEIVPLSPPEDYVGGRYAGPLGGGFHYRMAWVFVIRRGAFGPRWEALVDADTGDLLGFRDLNVYAKKQIKGGVYPVSNDGVSPDGVEQAGYPMPFADTGLPAPNQFTNSAGVFDWTTGTVQTTLNGKYIRISDNCGAVTETSTTGDVDLGTSGGMDCTVPPGHSPGDTHAARSAFYELNKMKEQARGWLSGNAWLSAKLTANVNVDNTCNANWDGTNVNFFKSGGGCRNTGEIAAIFDHEWGHGMDDNDANGTITSPGEAIADIYAAYRLHTSCIGRGFFWTNDRGCGQDANLTGYNCSGYGDCCLNCTGVRDIDYARHTSGLPHTPQNFIKPSCSPQFLCGFLSCCGPCGRECHCEGMVPAEAGWDLAARDLQAAPFNFDENTAFIIANRTAFLGSGSVSDWYACSGGGNSSNGCGAGNGYMQWLAADDDNGNINDGTPHMEAIYNAFKRHGIACSTPTPINSGCGSGPTSAPTLTATLGDFQVSLIWTPVTGTAKYWVFRGEGPDGCSFGKAKIAEVTGTSYTDVEVANGLNYHYVVMPVGTNSACMGPASNCVTITPSTGAPGEPGASTALTVTKSGGNLVFDWGAPASGCTATDYALYKGDITTLRSTGYSHDTVLTCSTGGATMFSLPITDTRIGTTDYYIVVGLNATHESSYGRQTTGGGTERPPSLSACRPQQNINTCI